MSRRDPDARCPGCGYRIAKFRDDPATETSARTEARERSGTTENEAVQPSALATHLETAHAA